jgi:hypothetical protein
MNFRIFTHKLPATLVLGLLLASSAFSQGNFAKDKPPVIKAKPNTGLNTNKLIPVTPKKHLSKNGKSVSNLVKALGDTLYFEPFATATWPADIRRINVDGGTPNGTYATIFGNNAWALTGDATNRVATSTSWLNPAGQVDRWMITPPITITAGNYLAWKALASQVNFQDGYEIRVCTNCPATINAGNVLTTFGTTIFSIAEEEANADDILVDREVSLENYAGQTIRIAFRNNSIDKNLLFIDDILVYRLPEKDVAAGEILSPDSTFYNCSGLDFPVLASVANKGSKTMYDVQLELRSAGPINDTVKITLDSLTAGKIDTILFGEGLNVSAVGEYQLELTVTGTDDINAANNQSNSVYIHAAPVAGVFSLNFDEITRLPFGWFSSSRFTPIIAGSGFDGTQGVQIPVYNNLATFGSDPDASVITGQFTNIPSSTVLSVKYHISNLSSSEYPLVDGDTVTISVFKNCEPTKVSAQIHSGNQSVSADFQKLFIPLDSLYLTPSDLISIEFNCKAAATTSNYLLDLDDVTLGTINDNDIAIANVETPTNSIYKKNQLATFSVKGSVFNEGSTAVSPVRIVALASPTSLEDTARISTIPGGFSKPFTTQPGFSITEAGDYSIDVTATGGQTDPVPANNTFSFPLSVSDSTMAKDFGDPADDFGLGYGAASGGKRIMANAISTTAKDTLTSVSIFVGTLDTDVQAKSFFANRNAAGTGWVEDSSSTLNTIGADLSNSWVTLRHRASSGPQAARPRGKAVAANTTNLYGVKIFGGNLRVSYNFNNTSDDGSWIWLGGQWLGTQDLTIGAVTFLMRPNFGRPATMVSVSQMEQSLQYADLIPNPTSGQSDLSIMMTKNSDVAIQVYSVNGMLVSSSTSQASVGANRIQVPTKGLGKGMYLVKVNASGFSTTKKLVIE